MSEPYSGPYQMSFMELFWTCYEIKKSVGRTFDILGAVENDFQLVIQKESYEIVSDL